jgi:hypothetical protein
VGDKCLTSIDFKNFKKNQEEEKLKNKENFLLKVLQILFIYIKKVLFIKVLFLYKDISINKNKRTELV